MRAGREHDVARHEKFRHESHRWQSLLRATAPRLAYRLKPNGSPRAACRWAVKVLSSGEVLHVRVAEQGEEAAA